MKKILMLAVATVALSTASFAATLTSSCSQASASVATGQATSNCAAFPLLPAGSTINSIMFAYGPDYTYNVVTPSGTESLSITAFSNVAGVTNFSLSNFVRGNPLPSPLSVGTFNLATLQSPYNVTYNFTGTGTVTAATFQGGVTLNYNLPASGVPEPSTVALIGAGLVGIASIARRRR